MVREWSSARRGPRPTGAWVSCRRGGTRSGPGRLAGRWRTVPVDRTGGCGRPVRDANPHAFVVAISRTVLPEGPFRVQLEARDPYPGAPEERTVVDVDLREPGSTATNEQVHADASLAVPVEPALVTDGDDLPTDKPVRYIYRDDPDCDTPVLGPLDGSVWRLADGEAAWDVQDGDELTLHPLGGSDSEIIASAPQMDWLFMRMPEATCP